MAEVVTSECTVPVFASTLLTGGIAVGSRGDLAIKLYGEDLDTLRRTADQIAATVAVRGAADVRAERVAGLLYLRIRLRRNELAQHGLDAASVLDTIESIGGKTVGTIVEGNKRFDMQVRFPLPQRESTQAVSILRVVDNEGYFGAWAIG